MPPVTPQQQVPPLEPQQPFEPVQTGPAPVNEPTQTTPQPQQMVDTIPVTQAAPQPTVASVPPPDTIAQIANQPHSLDPSRNEIYATLCEQIIKEQGQIIGVVSFEQASHVVGLTVNPQTYQCVVEGDPNEVLGNLVEAYREFFGNAAVEVCREAAARFATKLPNEQMPAILRS